MTSTRTARDEMQAKFYDSWRANTPAVNGGEVPPIRWDGLEETDPPPTTSPWGRVSIRHNNSPQTTFGEQRRFERDGIMTIQIFTPLSQNSGITLGEELAIIARDALEGQRTPSGVWFRNTRLLEVGPDDPWYQFNVVTEFTYDELK